MNIYNLLEHLCAGYEQYQRAADSETPESYNFDATIADLQRKHTDLNRRLARYVTIAQAQYFLAYREWSVLRVSRSGRDGFSIPYGGDPRSGLSVTEGTVVDALLSLTAGQGLWHARLCQQCRENWKAVDREIDKFCSAACRIKLRQSTPEGQLKHKLAMRKHRKQPGYRRDQQGRKGE